MATVRTGRLRAALLAVGVIAGLVPAAAGIASPPTISGVLDDAPEGAVVTISLEPPALVDDDLAPMQLVDLPVIASGVVGADGRFEVDVHPHLPILPTTTAAYVNIIVEQDSPDVSHLHVDQLEFVDGEILPVDVGTIPSKQQLIAQHDDGLPTDTGQATDASVIREDATGVGLRDLHGQNTYIRTEENVPETVHVVSNNTTYVRVSAGASSAATTQIGYVFGYENDWVKASGTYRRDLNTASDFSWSESQMPINDYGSWVVRVTADQRVYQKLSHHDFERYTSPKNPSGTRWPVRGGSHYLTHCAPMGGTTKITTGNGTTWGNGLKLSAAGFGIDSKSRTNFSEAVWVRFRPTTSGRYLCGRYAKPGYNGGDYAADYKNR